MMTLFETITQPVTVCTVADQHLTNSILWHLLQLLNTRQGSLQHLPDYGLPDICEIYQGLPQSINYLLQAIVNTVEKYEPRIKFIKATENKIHHEQHILSIKIVAETEIGSIDLVTYFDPVGYVHCYRSDQRATLCSKNEEQTSRINAFFEPYEINS